MKKKFYEVQTDEVSNATIEVLTSEGKKELERLESIYFSSLNGNKREKYLLKSDYEKLKYLLDREYHENRKHSSKLPEKRTTVIDYLSKKPDIDWLAIDLDMMESIANAFKSYLEEIEVAKHLILEERLNTELTSLKEQRSAIESQITELQKVMDNLFMDAVA